MLFTKSVAPSVKKREMLLYSNHLKLRKRAFSSTRKEGVEIVVLTWRRGWRGCITHLEKREEMLRLLTSRKACKACITHL
jgi:hypothetical protein